MTTECRYWLIKDAEWEVVLNLSSYPEPCGFCDRCGDEAEGHAERATERYYGGSGPQTERERYRIAAEEKKRIG